MTNTMFPETRLVGDCPECGQTMFLDAKGRMMPHRVLLTRKEACSGARKPPLSGTIESKPKDWKP